MLKKMSAAITSTATSTAKSKSDEMRHTVRKAISVSAAVGLLLDIIAIVFLSRRSRFGHGTVVVCGLAFGPVSTVSICAAAILP